MPMDMRRLDDKVLMVTGATRGIGRAAAARLGAEGARLVRRFSPQRRGALRDGATLAVDGGATAA
jgi:NAD(P)-dependent dehydrogenase (short-subunit alcohol dehydrogenase family)